MYMIFQILKIVSLSGAGTFWKKVEHLINFVKKLDSDIYKVAEGEKYYHFIEIISVIKAVKHFYIG